MIMSIVPPRLYEKGLSLVVKGQPAIYGTIAKSLTTAEGGLSWKGKPKHSFLFLGPTGTGKTETAKCISEMIFGQEKMIIFDMGSYQLDDTLPDFVKAFSSKIKSIEGQGSSVILFDEIEKATNLIKTLLLSMLDEARFTTDNGEVIDLSRHYLIFTSNLGCKKIIDSKVSDFATIQRIALTEAEKFFNPEVLARFGTVVVFNLLPYLVQQEICISFLKQYLQNIVQGRKVTYKDDVIHFLLRHGIDERLGARPLKGCIEKHVGYALASTNTKGDGNLYVQDREIFFQPTPKE